MTRNSQWMQRDLASLWHPCTQMKDHETLPVVPIRRGKGVWLEDFEGQRYLDIVSSWWVNVFGHANERRAATLCRGHTAARAGTVPSLSSTRSPCLRPNAPPPQITAAIAAKNISRSGWRPSGFRKDTAHACDQVRAMTGHNEQDRAELLSLSTRSLETTSVYTQVLSVELLCECRADDGGRPRPRHVQRIYGLGA